MDERTSDHLRTARANRVYALAIVNDDAASTTELNWAAVAAFYAAMHAINAYLWETARLEPANHRDRRNIMDRWPALTPLRTSYFALLDYSVLARYSPGFEARPPNLDALVNQHLAHFRTTTQARREHQLLIGTRVTAAC